MGHAGRELAHGLELAGLEELVFEYPAIREVPAENNETFQYVAPAFKRVHRETEEAFLPVIPDVLYVVDPDRFVIRYAGAYRLI